MQVQTTSLLLEIGLKKEKCKREKTNRQILFGKWIFPLSMCLIEPNRCKRRMETATERATVNFNGSDLLAVAEVAFLLFASLGLTPSSSAELPSQPSAHLSIGSKLFSGGIFMITAVWCTLSFFLHFFSILRFANWRQHNTTQHNSSQSVKEAQFVFFFTQSFSDTFLSLIAQTKFSFACTSVFSDVYWFAGTNQQSRLHLRLILIYNLQFHLFSSSNISITGALSNLSLPMRALKRQSCKMYNSCLIL